MFPTSLLQSPKISFLALLETQGDAGMNRIIFYCFAVVVAFSSMLSVGGQEKLQKVVDELERLGAGIDRDEAKRVVGVVFPNQPVSGKTLALLAALPDLE